MLYQIIELGELPGVIQAFRLLLDELTPFFKHIIENRAPQQRKLLALAAFHDRGASPSELAAESGLPERHVSALLQLLVKDGLLQRVRRPGSRTTAYPFLEPLLRMWLQVRTSPEGERRVICIVEFFRMWYAGAEAEFQRTLELQPDDLLALRSRSVVLMLAGRLVEGIADLTHILELQPDRADTLLLRGAALAQLGRFAEAVKDLSGALEMKPAHRSALFWRGSTLWMMGLLRREQHVRRREYRWLALASAGMLIPLVLVVLFGSRLVDTVRTNGIPSGRFQMDGVSMEPTFKSGDNWYLYQRSPSEIQRGDLVVFRRTALRNPQGSVSFIKRVVGLPGDTVEVRQGQLIVNGNLVDEPYIKEPMRYSFGPKPTPDGQLYVLCDNRNNSADSHLGWTVPFESIVGVAK
jgi:signal peptidase I